MEVSAHGSRHEVFFSALAALGFFVRCSARSCASFIGLLHAVGLAFNHNDLRAVCQSVDKREARVAIRGPLQLDVDRSMTAHSAN